MQMMVMVTTMMALMVRWGNVFDKTSRISKIKFFYNFFPRAKLWQFWQARLLPCSLFAAIPVWPDVEIKRSLNVTIKSLKSQHSSSYLKGVFFKVAQKVNVNFLGNFSEDICDQKLSKIAQSGHSRCYR